MSSLARYLPGAGGGRGVGRHDYDALAAIEGIFGEVPRVIQGVRW
ncbi:MAG TPA: hypothetical protein VLL52_16060 [Anaerolineae bacterium]|nr:hypothetical protein [Anaerolineae bacterium]